jgi:hypothetical protein
MASAIVPPIYDPTLADISARAATDDSHRLTRRLAKEEGLFVGPSSGAALAASLQLAADLKQAVIVMIFPDGGDRYLSEPLWDVSDGDEVAAPDPTAPAHLRITDVELVAMRRHAARIYPNECCGACWPGARQGDARVSARQHLYARAAASAVPRRTGRVSSRETRANDTGLSLLGPITPIPTIPPSLRSSI